MTALPPVAVVTRHADGSLTLVPAEYISAEECEAEWERAVRWAGPRWARWAMYVHGPGATEMPPKGHSAPLCGAMGMDRDTDGVGREGEG